MTVHNNTATTTTEATEGSMWYLAIGSMMLPESCMLRGFQVNFKESRPAKLLDYRLGFFSVQGFAEAIPSTGDSLHGVMHRVTPEQMKELDKIEMGYIRQTGKARPYGNSDDELVDVTVYCRPPGENKPEENKPPHERYLEILIAGAERFGLDADYIKFLKGQDCQPRTPPENYLGYPVPPNAKKFDKLPDNPFQPDGSALLCMNGKVVQVSYPADHMRSMFLKAMVHKFGPHAEVFLSHVAFDLKWGMVKNIKDCPPGYSAYIEDWHYRNMKDNNELQYFKVLGTLVVDQHDAKN